MKTKSVEPSPVHLALRNELVAVATKYKDQLSAPDILSVTAFLVGQVMAFQDQRTMTPEQAINIVRANIEAGNQQAIETTFKGIANVRPV